VAAVAGDRSIAGTLATLTGAGVTVRAAGATMASTAAPPVVARTLSLPATAFPHGALTVRLALPPVAPGLCAPGGGATRARTVEQVGRRLFASEAGGTRVRRVLAHVAHDPRFLRAVAARDPAALRAEIVRFFRDSALHVVRIRAWGADGRLIGDVGGPYVLAPAATALHRNGRTIGRVLLSVQDDTGYIKLLQRFTGATVVLRTAGRLVPGSGVPAPGPGVDRVTYAVGAFPSGPLQVTLAVPPLTAVPR
jgi:hypothetical protein